MCVFHPSCQLFLSPRLPAMPLCGDTLYQLSLSLIPTLGVSLLCTFVIFATFPSQLWAFLQNYALLKTHIISPPLPPTVAMQHNYLLQSLGLQTIPPPAHKHAQFLMTLLLTPHVCFFFLWLLHSLSIVLILVFLLLSLPISSSCLLLSQCSH